MQPLLVHRLRSTSEAVRAGFDGSFVVATRSSTVLTGIQVDSSNLPVVGGLVVAVSTSSSMVLSNLVGCTPTVEV